MLDAATRAAVAVALDETGVLGVPSSTRPLGDDEQPILLELRVGSAEHALRIWADVARASAPFRDFEGRLQTILDELSGGRLQGAP